MPINSSAYRPDYESAMSDDPNAINVSNPWEKDFRRQAIAEAMKPPVSQTPDDYEEVMNGPSKVIDMGGDFGRTAKPIQGPYGSAEVSIGGAQNTRNINKQAYDRITAEVLSDGRYQPHTDTAEVNGQKYAWAPRINVTNSAANEINRSQIAQIEADRVTGRDQANRQQAVDMIKAKGEQELNLARAPGQMQIDRDKILRANALEDYTRDNPQWRLDAKRKEIEALLAQEENKRGVGDVELQIQKALGTNRLTAINGGAAGGSVGGYVPQTEQGKAAYDEIMNTTGDRQKAIVAARAAEAQGSAIEDASAAAAGDAELTRFTGNDTTLSPWQRAMASGSAGLAGGAAVGGGAGSLFAGVGAIPGAIIGGGLAGAGGFIHGLLSGREDPGEGDAQMILSNIKSQAKARQRSSGLSYGASLEQVKRTYMSTLAKVVQENPRMADKSRLLMQQIAALTGGDPVGMSQTFSGANGAFPGPITKGISSGPL